MNVGELDLLVSQLQTLVGAQWQEVRLISNELGIGLYHQSQMKWLWVDLNRAQPWIFLDHRPGSPGKGEKKPLNLFMRAHFLGKRLSGVQRIEELGRVLCLYFGESYKIQIDLVPHAVNCLAQVEEKKVFWQKPKPLMTRPVQGDDGAHWKVRSLENLRELWKSKKNKKKTFKGKENSNLESRKKQIQKLEKALVKLEQDLSQKEANLWQEVGEWLSENQSLNSVPETYEEYINFSENFSWNLQNSFQMSKKIKQKIQRTQSRKQELLVDLKVLKSSNSEGNLTKTKAQNSLMPESQKSLLQLSKAKGRQLRVNGYVAFIGKSAKDNLLILRRAKPWYLWLHLRDFPSSHAVLQCKKGEAVPQENLYKVVEWLISQTFGESSKNKVGEKFDIIYAECRYVRPIKGDKVGRVNYTNDKSFVYKFKG